jgi:hypothetical protein
MGARTPTKKLFVIILKNIDQDNFKNPITMDKDAPKDTTLGLPTPTSNLFPALSPRTYMDRCPNDGIHLSMSDVKEEAREEGDTDSIVDTAECLNLEEAAQEAFWDRVAVLVKDELGGIESDVLENDVFKLQKGDKTLSFPKPPSNWTLLPPKEGTGEPRFSQVDIPGGWTEFSFRLKFIKGDKKKNISVMYSHHALLSGARPVPVDESGSHLINGRDFRYRSWMGSDTADLTWKPVQSNWSRKNPFPHERGSRLDYDLLKNLRMKKSTTILCCDALFFYHLILPFANPKVNPITTEGGAEMEDPRMPYYSEVERFTAKYAAHLGMEGSYYGHSFIQPQIPELAQFNFVLIRDGVFGSSKGSIHLRWKEGDAMFNSVISSVMTYTRFLQIKHTLKLNDNGAWSKDPCKTIDMIFKAIVHNTKAISKYVDSDQCVDETTFGHVGYGPPKAGVMRCLIGKKKDKGGQTVLSADVGRNRVCAYTHWHKLQEKPEDWKRQGCCEIRHISETLKCMVIGGGGDNNTKKLLRETPHITADNYF